MILDVVEFVVSASEGPFHAIDVGLWPRGGFQPSVPTVFVELFRSVIQGTAAVVSTR
jgi:hypothetical protein